MNDGEPVASLETLATRARGMIALGGRRLLGIAGPPGSGKSTLAGALCDRLGSDAVLVPMDGFHLSNQVLADLGLADRKGSPPTFDVSGFSALLERLRRQGKEGDEIVYAPRFDRDLEEAIAGAVPVPPSVPLVVVEGNYLLLDQQPWATIRAFFDQVWYLSVPEVELRRRLVSRHQRHGRTADEAARWVEHNDLPNARLVEGCRDRADSAISVPKAPRDRS